MRCTVCGREAMNPEANYCDYCGSSFRESGQGCRDNQTTTNGSYNESGISGNGYSAFGMSEYRESAESKGFDGFGTGEKKKITMWTFLGVMLLPMVPWVGTIAWLVILIYWAFSSQIDEARKSFARAYMIYMGISLVMLVGLVGMLTTVS